MSKMRCLMVILVSVVATCYAAGLKPRDLPEIPKDGKLWVVLAAGSNEWYNYRHQADICHAYQIVKSHGVPDENIIVFMYDDIANNSQNPTPGIIINKPGGPDVYAGVPKDYTKKNMKTKLFFDVLQGRKVTVGSKKTVQSGPDDNIFVYYSDHGGPGLVAFVDDVIYAKDLIRITKKMHSKKRFNKMVFYVEACESGSMFEDILPTNISVYAVTASNSTESSSAWYYDDERSTYLGDEFSINWLEDSDKENLNKRDLDDQFHKVKKLTTQSHVSRFGDMTFVKDKLIEFQGVKKEDSRVNLRVDKKESNDGVPSYEVPLAILLNRVKAAKSNTERDNAANQVKALLHMRGQMEAVTRNILERIVHDEKTIDVILQSKKKLTNHECYYPAVKAYNKKCFKLTCNDYALRQLYVFVNLCEIGFASQDIVKAINNECEEKISVCNIY